MHIKHGLLLFMLGSVAGCVSYQPKPLNTQSTLLDDIAHMPQLWAKYRERPEALVAEVEAEMRRVKALKRGA